MWIHLSDRYPRYTNATVLWANEHPDATDPIRDRHIISTAGPPLPGVRRRHGPLPAATRPGPSRHAVNNKKDAYNSRALARAGPPVRACMRANLCVCARSVDAARLCVRVRAGDAGAGVDNVRAAGGLHQLRGDPVRADRTLPHSGDAHFNTV